MASKYNALEQIKIRLRQFHTEEVSNEDRTKSEVIVFDHLKENPILEQLVLQAEADIKEQRRYPESYDEEAIEKDMEKFSSTIVNLALHDYVKEGAEFENSHSEPGVSRTYTKRNEILSNVIPFAKFIG